MSIRTVVAHADPEPVEGLLALQLAWQGLMLLLPTVGLSTPDGNLLRLAPAWVWGLALLLLVTLHTQLAMRPDGVLGQIGGWRPRVVEARRTCVLVETIWLALAATAWGADFGLTQRLGGFGLLALGGVWAYGRLWARFQERAADAA